MLMKFAVVSVKALKTVKFLRKILFDIDVMNVCLLLCFSIHFKKRFESVAKAFMWEVVLASLKMLEPIDP